MGDKRMLGTIAKDENQEFSDSASFLPRKGARVVEIGGSLQIDQVLNAGVAEWHAIDPLNELWTSCNGRYFSYKTSASSIPLPYDSVDFAFSSNAFEHIADLRGTLFELSRVLRPDGILYAHFGPIWSAPDGHHLETVIDGKVFEFWKNSVVPHWAHLALDEVQLKNLLETMVPEKLARSISNWVYHSSWLNRWCFEDYLKAFSEGPLHLVKFEACDEIDYELPFSQEPYRNLQKIAREKYGRERDIHTRDILAVLRKRNLTA